MRKTRSALAQDVPAMLAIYRPYVLETPVTFEIEPPSEEEFARRLEGGEGKFPWLICEDGGDALGYAYAVPFRARAAYAWSVESTVYVRQGHHRRGVGKDLYAALLPLLEEQGVVNVIGGITLPNEASRSLHESFGFEQVSHYKDAGFKQGRWWDVGYWQLQFAKPESPAPLKAPRSL